MSNATARETQHDHATPKIPIRTPPKRQAGESLKWWLEAEIYNRSFGEIGYLLGVVFTVAIGWFFHLTGWAHPLWNMTLGAGITAVVVITLFVRRLKRGQAIELGLLGERSVADILERLVKSDCKIFHDIAGDQGRGNLDHVVVGPGGVFVIETKTRRKRPGDKAVYDGTTLRLGTFDATQAILPQARACRDDIERRLQARLGHRVPVRGIVVLPGWWVDTTGKAELWVLNPTHAVSWIEREPTAIDRATAGRIAEALADWSKVDPNARPKRPT